MDKPLLLLDVDGPLNPDRMSNSVAKKRRFVVNRNARADLGVRARFHKNHGPMLHGFAEAFGFELVWCTAWNDAANRYVGPAIGLPNDLPVIHTPSDDWKRWSKDWKYQAVLGYALHRPLVWFDDEHLLRWTHRCQFLDARERIFDAPTLLVDVSPSTGITIEHLREVREWKETLQ